MTKLLEVKDVVAGYDDGPAILNGASIDVQPGKVHCIIGPNGAGKSTLLKAICGMLTVRHGSVTFEGRNLKGLRPDQVLREGICFVPQERALFPKNVGAGKPAHGWLFDAGQIHARKTD